MVSIHVEFNGIGVLHYTAKNIKFYGYIVFNLTKKCGCDTSEFYQIYMWIIGEPLSLILFSQKYVPTPYDPSHRISIYNKRSENMSICLEVWETTRYLLARR